MRMHIIKLTSSILVSLYVAACAPAQSEPLPTGCNSEGPTGPGRQHLALIIGVGDYAAEEVSDLDGTVNDAKTFRDILIDEKGAYRVDKENVCMLIDEQATLLGTLEAFNTFLLDRVDNEDHVTIFFAGHGSQVWEPKGNEEESDGLDETLVLHDSNLLVVDAANKPVKMPHLTDDVFGALLDAVNSKLTAGRSGAHALTVVLDSCNSLSATRGGNYTSRYFDATSQPSDASSTSYPEKTITEILEEAKLGSISRAIRATSSPESITDISPPGAVIMSAAGDGRVALEYNGKGVFTSALVQELALATSPITYGQLEWRVRSAMRDAYQAPGFHGQLDALVFDSKTAGSGAAHRVEFVRGNQVTLVGTPVFGVGPDAEFRIYDGALAGSINDPTLAKAVVKITEGTAIKPEGTASRIAEDEDIKIGDLAVLITPSPDARRLSVALSENLSADFAKRLSERLNTNKAVLIDDTSDYDFMVRTTAGAEIGIYDIANRLRVAVAEDQKADGRIATSLDGFARQKSLRHLRGEGGGALQDNQTLGVELIQYEKSGENTNCIGEFQSRKKIEEAQTHVFEVPICTQYQFSIELKDKDIDTELQIGVLYLSSDGNIYSIPANSKSSAQGLRLSPPSESEPGNLSILLSDVYQSLPPPAAEDEVLVFAVDAKTPVPWWALATSASQRSTSAQQSSLHRELDAYMKFGSRAGGPVATSDDPLSLWTVTRVAIRTIGDDEELTSFLGAQSRGTGDGEVHEDYSWSSILCPKNRKCYTNFESGSSD